MSTALITGATAGIGHALAECFARGGHDLVLVARGESRLEEIATELSEDYDIEVTIIPADLSDPEMPEAIFDTATEDGPVEYLVNNAGFGVNGPFVENDLATELEMIQVNVASVVALTKFFLQDMVERDSGRIMNVSSIAAFQAVPNMGVYAASKAFVLSFTEAVAFELRKSKVTVTALCPGATSTEFMERADFEGHRLMESGLVPMMSPAKVAVQGYRAMMKGKAIVVPGLGNKLGVHSTRIASRKIAAAVSGTLMSK